MRILTEGVVDSKADWYTPAHNAHKSDKFDKKKMHDLFDFVDSTKQQGSAGSGSELLCCQVMVDL